MPKFTISKDGKTLDTLTFEGERIELGSANTCKLFIDDLLISLHQAAFLKTSDGYDIEPIARTPSFTMNGEKVDERKALAPNAVIKVEGYEIRIDFGASGGGAAAESLAPPLPEPLSLPPEPSPLAPIDLPKAKPVEPPKPPPTLPPLPPLDPPKPTPAETAKATPAPREKSLPPLPPPLPPIPEPLFSADAPPKELPPVQSSGPPPLPPLPPLEPPPPLPKAKSVGEAPTQYVIPIKPIGQLVVTAGPLKGKSWPLAGSELKIGREQGQNDILVRFDAKGEIDTSISRRHATIHIEGDYAFVEDVGSVAGTFVNGRPATKGERVPLRSGDEIEVRSAKESTMFRVELGEPSPKAAPPLPKPSSAPLPPIPSAAPSFEPPPEPQLDSRRRERDEPREREPIRRRERQSRVSEDNPFAPVEAQGMPQWVWFAIGGAVVVIILILVFLFI